MMTVDFGQPIGVFHNTDFPLDVNGNGLAEVSDAVSLVNALNGNSSTNPSPLYLDVNNDSFVDYEDSSVLIGALNSQIATEN